MISREKWGWKFPKGFASNFSTVRPWLALRVAPAFWTSGSPKVRTGGPTQQFS